jgi:arylsulfatase A
MKSFCFVLLGWVSCAFGATSDRPNILLMLADDLGYGDLACYGEPNIRTPHLDRLAAEGLRLTHCYAAAANCSPSRAGLMTGRNPWRLGIHNWIPMMSPMHLKAEEVTVGTLLRDAGYATGHFGKWHLNGLFNLPGQPQPDDHGFQYWFSTQNNALPNHRDPWNFVRNDIPVGPMKGFAGDLVAEETVQWLEGIPDMPFFAFVCFHEPHEPIASSAEHMAHYADMADPRQRAHHGNVTQLDAGVGRILGALDELGLRENTLVWFTSDNGPARTGKHPYGSSAGLREYKGHLYEGGVRVPCLIRWPGVTTPGSVSDVPVIGTDFLPTVCEIQGIEPPSDRQFDGSSVAGLLSGGSVERERPLYWHFYRAKSEVKVAMRDGDWKVVARLDGPPFDRGADITEEEIAAYKTAGLTGFELYHLGADPEESYDVKGREPETFERLRGEITRYYEEVRDESPSWPSWVWPRYEGGRIEWPEYDLSGIR